MFQPLCPQMPRGLWLHSLSQVEVTTLHSSLLLFQLHAPHRRACSESSLAYDSLLTSATQQSRIRLEVITLEVDVCEQPFNDGRACRVLGSL